MSKLGDALRKKYRTPRDAIKALDLDESLLNVPSLALDGAKHMKTTRLEYLAVTGAVRAISPLLMAMDSKGKAVTVDLAPIFKGLTTKNLKSRKAKIVGDVKAAIKGKTIAKDASVEHLAHMLDQFEHVNEPKSLDESVSPEQHRAMEAAAHGSSNLGIPKDVGKEFERADAGKSFDEMLMDWAKDRGMSEDDLSALKKMHADSMPENALDEDEEAEDETETEAEAEDETAGEAEDESEEERAAREKREKAAKDKAAKDRKGAMDTKTKPITQDEVNKAIETAVARERKSNQDALAAREFVRPYVGEVALAFDTAEKIYRAAAKAMHIEDAETIHASALKAIIKATGRPADDSDGIAQDGAPGEGEGGGGSSLEDFIPEAGRIQQVA